ncbi:MAG: autotransporter-associated beta strand repeat-containing protein [Kiritimatiellia bacterium]
MTGTVCITGGKQIKVYGNNTFTLNGVVSGAGASLALQSGNTPTVILTANNTYTGDTTIGGGTLQVGNGGTTGSLYSPTVSSGNLTFGSAGAILNNGALVYNISGGAVNVNKTISGTGTLSVTGNQSVNFANGTSISTTGSQTYSATATTGRYYGFNLTDNATATLTSTAGNISMTGYLGTANGSTGNLVINTNTGNGNVTLNTPAGISGVDYGLNSLTVNAGTGTIALGTHNAQNWVTVNTISLNGGAINSTANLTSFTTLTVNNSSAGTFSGNVTASGGALVKQGAGTLTLSSSGNTYTGGTTISGGTLQVGNGGTTGSLGSGNIVNNGTLAYSFGNASAVSLPSGAGITGSGNLNATARDLKFNGSITLGGSQSFTENGGGGLYQGLEVFANTTLTGSSITMSGDVGKRDSSGNTLTLDTSASNGTVNLNVSTGRLNVWYNLSSFTVNAGTGTINVTGTGPASSGWSSPVTLNGALNISGNISKTGAAVFHATAASTISGSLGLNQSLTGYNNFNVDNGVTMTVSGQVNGVSGVAWGGINKQGAGTLSLTNASNTYGQGLQLNGGTVEFSNNALKARNSTDGPGYAADFQANSTLRWGSGNTTDISAGGQVKIGDGVTATFDTNGSSPTFASAFTLGGSSTGALTKAGAGTLTLSAANTNTGATTVNGGTLVYQNAYASTSHSIASGATLEFNVASGTADRAATTFSGAGTLKKTGAGNLTWGGTAATFSLGSGALIDVQGGTFTAGNGANEVWTNNKADLNVAAGAVFDAVEGTSFANGGIFVDALSGAGTIKVGYTLGGPYGDMITFGVDNGSGTFSGVLANSSTAGRFTKAGTGTQTLTNANTYTGATTVNGGTLVYQNAYASPSHSIAAGATLEFNVASGTADRAATTFSGAGTLTKTGAGILRWSGTAATFSLGSGSMIDVQGGTFTASDSGNEIWTSNKADLNVASARSSTGSRARSSWTP